MSNAKDLEQVFEHLLANNTEQASELLRAAIVTRARGIYESIVEADEIASIPSEDFVSDVEVQPEGDEFAPADDAASDEVAVEEPAMQTIEEIESALAALKAEMAELLGTDEEDDSLEADLTAELPVDSQDDDMQVMSDDEPFQESVELSEATEFAKKVADANMKGEGKLAGTGKDGNAPTVNTASVIARAKKPEGTGSPVVAKDGGQGSQVSATAKPVAGMGKDANNLKAPAKVAPKAVPTEKSDSTLSKAPR